MHILACVLQHALHDVRLQALGLRLTPVISAHRLVLRPTRSHEVTHSWRRWTAFAQHDACSVSVASAQFKIRLVERQAMRDLPFFSCTVRKRPEQFFASDSRAHH